MNASTPPPLEGRALTVRYDGRTVLDGLDLHLPAGAVTILVGRNGCGKSTLLKSFARLLRPHGGHVLLHGADLHRKHTTQIARELAILPQGPAAPDDLSVEQLVRLGRYSHQGWLQTWSREDQHVVERVLAETGLQGLRARAVETLSGGQRQRAWIAMALAQDTPVLLLDEPTTYLDLAHQVDVLDLLAQLNARHGTTIAMVLHDLNLACRYAHHLVALRDGRVFAQGAPSAIVNEAMVQSVFGLDCHVMADPVHHTPLCIPRSRHTPDAAWARQA
ncbi:MAG: putative siderophore transport system ATP-binding protein YusV [Paracidovorax wautersii]|uniref:Putative siderophore transport system ATP-binding protein YusV n=1 Tax=Paracidovorax wautersii TaxID=1177982 RepID=A0A7V8JRH3_9BURK|nr:MAG: putative siderophore transport system ATP-binding protein YusV [Paracidovorax wautersii]